MWLNKAEKEIAKVNLKAEEKTLKELQQIYKKARKDVKDKIAELNSRTDMQNLESIVYQKKYQEAILDQINQALDDLKSGQYKTIDEYLHESYENGYVGMMYSLQSQGIPITFPIDDRKVVRALTTDSKLVVNYYKADPIRGRVAEDVDLLKTRIRTNLSRGIVAGKSWLDVAVDIASGMNNPFDIALKDATRIARTEGHRVNQQGFLDAGDVAREKGADIVKQWDATMDRKTRPAHQQADGQIVEWDEDFIVGGEKMKAPSIGGSAKNVCNCRCQLLQRARWMLDEEELQELQERANFFGLDKSESFEDFKQKYLEVSKDPILHKYGNMTYMQKKESILDNEKTIENLKARKKQEEMGLFTSRTVEEMQKVADKVKATQKQIDDLIEENNAIQKILGIPTNAKERFLSQDIAKGLLPQDVRDSELGAVSTWTRNGYTMMNKYLRNGDVGVPDFIIEETKILQDCLERNVVQEAFTVKRGIGEKAMSKWFGGDSWKQEGFLANGQVIVDKGFCATTPYQGGGFGNVVQVYIDIPAGVKGAYIGDLSAKPDEKEFLLQCDTHFSLEQIERKTNKWGEPVYDVYMKVIV